MLLRGHWPNGATLTSPRAPGILQSRATADSAGARGNLGRRSLSTAPALRGQIRTASRPRKSARGGARPLQSERSRRVDLQESRTQAHGERGQGVEVERRARARRGHGSRAQVQPVLIRRSPWLHAQGCAVFTELRKFLANLRSVERVGVARLSAATSAQRGVGVVAARIRLSDGARPPSAARRGARPRRGSTPSARARSRTPGAGCRRCDRSARARASRRSRPQPVRSTR